MRQVCTYHFEWIMLFGGEIIIFDPAFTASKATIAVLEEYMTSDR